MSMLNALAAIGAQLIPTNPYLASEKGEVWQ
jgi:hypothetical protein